MKCADYYVVFDSLDVAFPVLNVLIQHLRNSYFAIYFTVQ